MYMYSPIKLSVSLSLAEIHFFLSSLKEWRQVLTEKVLALRGIQLNTE